MTGQQLCEAIRQYALEQYGLMAQCVLNSCGVYTTGDFGEIVYAGMDLVDPKLGRRSMELMAHEVMPRVNAAIRSGQSQSADVTA